MKKSAILTILLAFSFFVLAAGASATTWNVPGDGSGTCTTGNPSCNAIQDAISAATAGDTINVAAGTYYENVVINKPLSLIGALRTTTTIDGSNVGNAVTITASNVTLSGFTITGGQANDGNIWDPYGGVVIDGNGGSSALTNIVINDNIIDSNAGNGIYVSAAGHGGLEDNIKITNCTISNNGGLASFFGGISVTYGWFDGGGTCDLGPDEEYDEWRRPKNVLIEGNELSNNASTGYVYGIYINGGQDNTIRSNDIHGFAAKGLLVAASMPCTAIPAEYTTVENNEIYDNAQNGIKLVSWNHHNTFTGNKIFGNGYLYTGAKEARKYGFNFKDGDHNTIQNNEIYDNCLGGLYLWGYGDPSYTWYSTTDNTITCNTISDHTAGHGIYIPDKSRPSYPSGYPNSGFQNSQINWNNITNNDYGLENVDDTQIVDAECNWWGDMSGPYHPTTNPAGTGDAVSAYVDYDPWLMTMMTYTGDTLFPASESVVLEATLTKSGVSPPESNVDFYVDDLLEDTVTTVNGVATLDIGVQPVGVYAVRAVAGCLEAEALVAVYDPTAGFVTGGGWIESPEGAYHPAPSLTGKASFGFVSKYKKGAQTPSGNTEFVFKAADLNFHSSSYEWLLVTGSDYARFKGAGTINGMGDYKFMLWAGDGDPDTFHIRIWWEDDADSVEHVVYDNAFDQAIGGGSIVVHTPKK